MGAVSECTEVGDSVTALTDSDYGWKGTAGHSVCLPERQYNIMVGMGLNEIWRGEDRAFCEQRDL